MIMIALLKSLDNLKMKSESLFREDAHAGDVLDNSSTSDSNSSNSSYSSFSSSFKQQ